MLKIQLVLVISLVFFSPSLANAQTVEPIKSTIKHKEGFRPCIMVSLDSEAKAIKKAWVKFLKKKYNFKPKGTGFLSNKDLLYAEQVVIEQVSPKHLDFFTLIVVGQTKSEMKVFASFGYDIYINEDEYPLEFFEMSEMLNLFLKEYLPDYYKKQIQASSKTVKSLKKEITSLKKQINKNKEIIEEQQEKAGELNQEIEESLAKLVLAENQLKEREEKLKEIKIMLENL